MESEKNKEIGYQAIAVGYFTVIACATIILFWRWINDGKPPLEPLIISISGVMGYGVSRLILTIKNFKIS
ncbi:MAG: hypothetical protein K6U80_05375 [Firmicutes bacterium]|nr:hypothetical protein [Bacillota bacterium]